MTGGSSHFVRALSSFFLASLCEQTPQMLAGSHVLCELRDPCSSSLKKWIIFSVFDELVEIVLGGFRGTT